MTSNLLLTLVLGTLLTGGLAGQYDHDESVLDPLLRPGSFKLHTGETRDESGYVAPNMSSKLEQQDQAGNGTAGLTTKTEECKDAVTVHLHQDISQGSHTAYLNCSFNRQSSDALSLIFYSGPLIIFYYDFYRRAVVAKDRYVHDYGAPNNGYWHRIYYSKQSCHDFTCRVVDRIKGEGQDSATPGIDGRPQVYMDGSCISCSNNREIYVEEIKDITLSCNVSNVRPAMKLTWDDPLRVIHDGEITTPRQDCNGVSFDQASIASATFDGTRHWHVCCTATSLHENGGAVYSTPIVTFKYRAPTN